MDNITNNIVKGRSIPHQVTLFLTKAKLTPSGICALTVGKDYESLAGTFIFDFKNNKMLDHYPGFLGKNGQRIEPIYKHIDGIKWTINFASDLQPKEETGLQNLAIKWNLQSYPFCCIDCKQERLRNGGNRSTTKDSVFKNFFNSSGTFEHAFCVITKVQYGPVLSRNIFTLKNGNIIKVNPDSYEHLLNTFKAYTCSTHNLYFVVDLRSDKPHASSHHVKPKNDTDYGPQILNLMENGSDTDELIKMMNSSQIN
jgi:hypothetical protein